MQIAAMNAAPLTIYLPDPAATDAIARQFADHVPGGCTLLLSGPIGAGKSHFARAFIRRRLGYPGDIPSPTFTLVQTYHSETEEVWHADLYRLSHPDEAAELGLDEAIGTAICVIEWPDRLGDLVPQNAIRLAFRDEGEGRSVAIDGLDSKLAAALLARLKDD